MAQTANKEQATTTKDDSSNNVLIKAATQMMIDPQNAKVQKTALMIAGGISIGALLYKAYKALPSPHSSVPTASGMHPILGHAPFFVQNYDKMHDALCDVIGQHEIIAMKLPDFYQLFLNNPKLIEWVFTTEFDKFYKGDSQNEKFCDLFGEYGSAIFVSDDKHWRFHRKIGSRMFSVRNLRDYMYYCCENTTKSTLNILESLRANDQMIDINDILGRMTFDCFTSIAFGQSFDSMSLYPSKHPFGCAFDACVELFSKRTTEPFWKLKRALNIDYEYEIAENLKIINTFCNELIAKKAQSNASNQRITDETGIKTFDLFTLYNDHKQSLTNEEMKFLALNFIIAGRDTTRMLISWFLYDLSVFSEVKSKVIAEIDAFNDEHKENENGVDYASITKKFKYLEAALCESLRYHPVVPFSVREARSDVVIPSNIVKPQNGAKNYVIRKGDRCVIHHYTISKMERFYKDPLKYDPVRFIEKGVRTFSQATYPFFNQSPRLCLGRDFALMEAKMFLYSLLTTYSYEVVPDQNVVYTPGIILNMKNGLKITLKKR